MKKLKVETGDVDQQPLSDLSGSDNNSHDSSHTQTKYQRGSFDTLATTLPPSIRTHCGISSIAVGAGVQCTSCGNEYRMGLSELLAKMNHLSPSPESISPFETDLAGHVLFCDFCVHCNQDAPFYVEPTTHRFCYSDSETEGETDPEADFPQFLDLSQNSLTESDNEMDNSSSSSEASDVDLIDSVMEPYEFFTTDPIQALCKGIPTMKAVLPAQLAKVQDLGEILNWANYIKYLTPIERKEIESRHLPRMTFDVLNKTLRDIFERKNIFFGNPIDKLHSLIRSGLAHEKVMHYFQRTLFLEHIAFQHNKQVLQDPKLRPNKKKKNYFVTELVKERSRIQLQQDQAAPFGYSDVSTDSASSGDSVFFSSSSEDDYEQLFQGVFEDPKNKKNAKDKAEHSLDLPLQEVFAKKADSFQEKSPSTPTPESSVFRIFEWIRQILTDRPNSFLAYLEEQFVAEFPLVMRRTSTKLKAQQFLWVALHFLGDNHQELAPLKKLGKLHGAVLIAASGTGSDATYTWTQHPLGTAENLVLLEILFFYGLTRTPFLTEISSDSNSNANLPSSSHNNNAPFSNNNISDSDLLLQLKTQLASAAPKLAKLSHAPQAPTEPQSTPLHAPHILPAFHQQELSRFSQRPDRPFLYSINGVESIVPPITERKTKATDRGIFILDKPDHLSISVLVREAAARLPGGVGTRKEVYAVAQESQFVKADVGKAHMNSSLRGSLEKLQGEQQCVQFVSELQIWVYLHKYFQLESYEGQPKVAAKKRAVGSAGGGSADKGSKEKEKEDRDPKTGLYKAKDPFVPKEALSVETSNASSPHWRDDPDEDSRESPTKHSMTFESNFF